MRPIWALPVLLIACTPELPSVQDTISPEAQAAEFPTLGPIDAIVASAKRPSPAAPEGDALEERVDALKERADLLRGKSVEDGQTALSNAR